MRVLVIDSNIVWSAAYNPNSEIGQFLILSKESQYQFYAPNYLKVEIENHFPKIVKLSGLTTHEVRDSINLAYSRINFISDDQIPFEFYAKAAPLVRDIDPNDIVFVALADYLDEYLLTGDVKLYGGLIDKGYKRVVKFSEIKILGE